MGEADPTPPLRQAMPDAPYLRSESDGGPMVTGAPIRLFHGIADDYVAIAPCRAYVERLKAADVNVVLTEYPDAFHAYDGTAFSPPIQLL
jgi:predicted esterase